MKNDPKRSDWLAYKRLNRLRGAGLQLTEVGNDRLMELQSQYPDWKLDGSERDEFAIWSQVSVGKLPDTSEFDELESAEALTAIRVKSANDPFDHGETWNAYIKAKPDRAFAALVSSFRDGSVQNTSEWRQLFWTLHQIKDNDPLQSEVADWLIGAELTPIIGCIDAAANWLEGCEDILLGLDGGPERVLQIWDKLSQQVAKSTSDPLEDHSDLASAVLNSAAGVLPGIIVSQIARQAEASEGMELLADRLDRAISWPDGSGTIAQVRLLQRLPYLEYRLPDWTLSRLAPSLNQKDSLWLERWDARFHHQHPGSANLFELTKASFLETFDHVDKLSHHESQVLLLINGVLSAIKDEDWPLAPAEAKQALLRGGEQSLEDVCRLLRNRDGAEDPAKRWKELVCPILQFAWPLDDKARSKRSTDGLLHLVFDSGSEFASAAKVLANSLTPSWGQRSWGIDQLFRNESLDRALEAPNALLLLLTKIVDPNAPSSKLNFVLDRLQQVDEKLATKPEFRRLRGLGRKAAA